MDGEENRMEQTPLQIAAAQAEQWGTGFDATETQTETAGPEAVMTEQAPVQPEETPMAEEAEPEAVTDAVAEATTETATDTAAETETQEDDSTQSKLPKVTIEPVKHKKKTRIGSVIFFLLLLLTAQQILFPLLFIQKLKGILNLDLHGLLPDLFFGRRGVRLWFLISGFFFYIILKTCNLLCQSLSP